MKKVETVVLDEAVEVKGRGKVTDVEVRRPTVADEEDAMDMAIGMRKGDNRITLEVCTYSRVTGIKYEDLRNMDADDFTKIRNAYARVVAPLEPSEREQSQSQTNEQQKSA